MGFCGYETIKAGMKVVLVRTLPMTEALFVGGKDVFGTAPCKDLHSRVEK
jgi:hypothetical protein